MIKRYYKDTALPLMKRGFEVVPITQGKKFPEGLDWKNLPQTEKSYNEMVKKFGDNAGLGVVTSNHLLAIDIDVLDPHAARELIQYVREMLSTDKIMVRRGKKPKALIPCYVPNAIGKIVSSVWYSEKYGRMQIELLNNSKDGHRQFVAFGDYPDEEGLHYEWENDYSLLDIERVEDLPTFRPEMIQPLFRYFDDLMYRNE